METQQYIAVVCILIAAGVFAENDPAYYVKQDSWQETMLFSSQALQGYLETHRREIMENLPSCGPWYRVGPFSAENAFTKVFAPELQQGGRAPCGGKKWRRLNVQDGTVHSLSCPANAVLYFSRTIEAPRDLRLMAYFGSDDGIAVWLNRKQILSKRVLRGVSANQDHVPLQLEKGGNELLVKIWNGRGGCGWYFSFHRQPGASFDPRVSLQAQLWDRVKRDFRGTRAREEMAYEKADGIWNRPLKKNDFSALAGRYVASIKRTMFAMGKKAEQLVPAVKSMKGLRPLQELYYKAKRTQKALTAVKGINLPALRRAIEDLTAAFPGRYPDKYPAQLEKYEALFASGNEEEIERAAGEFVAFSRDALLANPLLDFDRLLVLRRRFGDKARSVNGGRLGTPNLNSHTNDDIPHRGWDNEIAVMTCLRTAPKLETLYKPEKDVILRDIDLEFDGGRIMFSSISAEDRWALFEIKRDGTGLAQLNPKEIRDVDFFDSCYLPNGKIVTCSTAPYQGLPCENGGRPMVSLYLLDPETKNIRQLTFEQDSDWHPCVLNNGRVLYLRWEYTDTPHYFSRYLFHMNPDGTNQSEFYGSGSYFPTAFKHARQVPGRREVVGIVGGHHSTPESGRLMIINNKYARKYPFRYEPESKEFGPPGSYVNLYPQVLPKELTGCVQEIPGYGNDVVGNVLDGQADPLFKQGRPRFLYPYPLSEKYFLVSMKRDSRSLWGIYLVDVFDNMTLIMEAEGEALLEVYPFRKRARPPILADRVDLSKKTATVYMTDVYQGGGLKNVPRGRVKKLRIFTYHYAYNRTGGHTSVGIESSWDVKRILGTVAVEEDGSATFTIPANTPVSVQPLDEDGAALQLMRSWFVGMPGETLSCVGCHERQSDTTPVRPTIASSRKPREIQPWLGRPRPFAFDTEVQPVLDRYCAGCHCPEPPAWAAELAGGKKIPDFVKHRGGANWSTSYRALHPYVRRPGPESDLAPFQPMEYHASTSDLVQLLKKGHYGVALDRESWERFYAWIDLNAPYRGAWNPADWRGCDQIARRLEFQESYANISVNPEAEFEALLKQYAEREKPLPVVYTKPPEKKQGVRPFMSRIAGTREKAVKTLEIGGGEKIQFVHIPAGEFVMGSADGLPDERPMSLVKIEEPFWMGVVEITNSQYAQFDPYHDTRYIDEHGKDHAVPGFIANHRDQPVARISWREAMNFCRWLSRKSGLSVTLPTEAQWEWAARAGTGTRFFYGTCETDFSPYANLADRSLHFTKSGFPGGSHLRHANPYNSMLNYPLRDNRFNDQSLVSNYAGRYRANPWGVKDIIGNVNEWTRSDYAPYPYEAADGRNDGGPEEKKAARGGSWYDRPAGAGAAVRFPYESYQKVHNVGFRVIVEKW